MLCLRKGKEKKYKMFKLIQFLHLENKILKKKFKRINIKFILFSPNQYDTEFLQFILNLYLF